MEGSKELCLSPSTLCHSVSPLPQVQRQALAAGHAGPAQSGDSVLKWSLQVGWILLTTGTSSSILCATESRAGEAEPSLGLGVCALQSH